MLVGGDLGFLSSLVAAFVAVLAPVLGFVIRREWRRSVARKEEVKRLLVFTSDEEARFELQAAQEYGYSYGYTNTYGSVKEDDVFVETPKSSSSSSTTTSRQLQYQCAVCSAPTSTRCSRCKAARYCSGKCQILHWRQGHKNECHPVGNSDHRNDVDGTSHLKESNGSHLQGIGVEGRHSLESADVCKDSAPSTGKDDTDGQSPTEAKSSNSNSSFVLHSSPSEHLDLSSSSESSIDLSASDSSDLDGSDSRTNQSKVDGSKPPHAELPKLVCPVDIVSPPRKYSNSRPHTDDDAQSKYWTPTCSSVDDSSEPSSSEPSTPSDFWERAVPSTRSRIDSLNGTAYSPSRHACDVKISDSQPIPCQPSETARPTVSEVGRKGSNSKKNLENPNPVTVEVRELVNRAESTFEVKDETESRRSSALRSATSNQLDVHDSSDKGTLLTSKDVSCSTSSASGYVKNHDGLKLSSKPNRLIEDVTGVLQMPKDTQRESSHAKTSVSHISSTNGRREVQTVKSAMIDSIQVASACSTESSVPFPNSKNGLKSSVLKVVDQFRGSKLTRHKSLGDECDVTGRYGNKGIFPYETFVKLYTSKIELRPFGLENCGNSCYANAVLQCLAFTPPLTSYFLQGLHSKTCEKKGWCFTCEFESLVLKAKNGNSRLSPIRIISHLESIGSTLGNGREEDAHEFLRYVIDTMQSICLKEAGVSSPGSFEEETTLVGHTFGGYLRSKIECMRCGGKSERQERMMDLTVEIDGDIGTLEEALRQFTRTETLDGENKYRCSRCKSYEKAKKKLKVLEAPNILTIALKRFQSGNFGKLNKTINFPEFLNMARYVSGTSDKSPVYQLYGVVVHLDIMDSAFSGHYVCYVRNFLNKWFKVDDSSVQSVECDAVFSKRAYMLLYSRCSPRAPRIMRSLTIPRDPRRSKQLTTCKSRSQTESPWDTSHGVPTGQTCSDYSYPSHTTVRPSRRIFDDDSSSEQSAPFSEAGSCSTDSTNRDSTSNDDLTFNGDESGVHWNNGWRNSSDSDTSSSSPSPHYSRHSPLADLDRYASGHAEPSFSDGLVTSGQDFWSVLTDYAGDRESKHSRNLVSSYRSSKTDSSRLCRVNPSDNSKSPATCRDR